MNYTTKQPPEIIERIRVLSVGGMSCVKIARELGLGESATAKILRHILKILPTPRAPAKEAPQKTLSRHAKADYSSAKVTRVPMTPYTGDRVNNALARDPYVPRELTYRK